jgi:hypothetical protein
MAGPIHELSGEQYEVLYQVVYYGETHGANGMEILAAVETGLVEDRLHNRNTATAANPAVGWRQEEPSYGSVADRLNLSKSIPNFYNECKERRGRYKTSGELAQAVQRSAYPKRYGEVEPLAKTLIAELGKNRAKPGISFGSEPGHLVGLQSAVSQTSDPPDHSAKVRTSGKKLGEVGSSFAGHAKAMRNLAARSYKH